MRWLRGVLPVAAGVCAVAIMLQPALAQVESEWLLVVDGDAGRVLLVAPDGSTAPIADGLPSLVAPGGLALHPDGESVAVVDAGAGPNAGSVLVLAPEGPPIPVAGGLDAPGGVVWADDVTLIVTAAAGAVLRIDVQSAGIEEIATLPGEAAGIVAFEGFGQSGMLVPSVSGPVVLVDPGSGEFVPFTDDLDGAGHPSVDPTLGLCVPELASDGVRCFAFDGSPGSEFGPVADPVAAGSTSGGLVVAGADGLVLVDGNSGTITPLATGIATPTAVTSLGSDPGPWAAALDAPAGSAGPPATAVETEPPTTEGPATTLAEAPTATEVPPSTTETAVTTAVGDDPADDLVRAEDGIAAADGTGEGVPPWPALAVAVTVVLGVSTALVLRRRKRPPAPVEEPGDPGVFHARRAQAAAAAGVEPTFWNAYRAAEEQAVWLQEWMRVGRDAEDRRLFDHLQARQHRLVDEIAPTPAVLRASIAAEAPDPFGESTATTAGGSLPVGADGSGDAAHTTVIADRAVLDVVRSRLDEAVVLVRGRRRETDGARRDVEQQTKALAVRHAPQPADAAGLEERLTAPADAEGRPVGPTDEQLVPLVPDDRLAEHYWRVHAEELVACREAVENARQRYLAALDAYFRTTPGREQHDMARHELLAAQRRYEEAQSTSRELRPPGSHGSRIVAARLRRALREGTAPTEGLDANSADGPARLAELDRERAELDERLDAIARLRAALADVEPHGDITLGGPGGRWPATGSRAATSERAAARWTMHLHVDVAGPPHTAIGLRGPDLDIVFSMAGGRDTIGLHSPAGWSLGATDSDDGRADLEAATNRWYRDQSAARARRRGELTVSLTEAQFDECHARLTAFARSRPSEEYAPIPGADAAVRCPAPWMVVRSVFTPVTTYGTAWFERPSDTPDHPWSHRSVIDDALSIFAPRLLGRAPAPYDWNEAG